MAKTLTLAQKKAVILAARQPQEVKVENVETVVAIKAERKTRVRNVFNGTEGKLKVTGEIPGYHLYIMNDSPGRISTALDGGYEFVSPSEIGQVGMGIVSKNTDLGVEDRVRFRVGVDEHGAGLFAYLMKIRQEWYEEDQKAIQDRVDLTDEAIRKGKATQDGQSTEGFYVPTNGIKMSRK